MPELIPTGFTLGGELDLLLPITALLPLTAVLLVSQGDPYQTLILRGILGAIATLIYALLGAPDVALTEAMVGTLLSTTLYAVALRSSMAFRLAHTPGQPPTAETQRLLRSWLQPLHLRLQLVSIAGDDPEAAGCHGLMLAERQLLVRRPRLRQRLQQLEGWRQWQSLGGLLLAPEAELAP